MKRITLSTLTAMLLAATSPAVHAGFADGVIKIGVLGDMSGLYSDVSGKGAIAAAQMAVEDYGGTVAGLPIKIVSADHLNKADVAAATAREWFDVEKVDMITDLVNSAAALAVSAIGKEKNKVVLVTGAGVSDLTRKACSPNTIHWTYDTSAIAKATATALIGAGYKSWYFLTADYAFGTAMQRDATKYIEAAGGTIVGSVRHPLSPMDFSSYLLTAQSSGAQVIALANAGNDMSTAVKQANEFGIGKGKQRLAGLLVTLTDVHSIGAKQGQGLTITTPFYWDKNDQTRRFTAEFSKRTGGMYPTMMQAGVYSSVLHYLKALEASKTDDGAAVVARMKELPTDDPLFGKGAIRADGRKLHPMYVYEVKSPAESTGPWDLYKLLYSVPAEQAFLPMSEGGCTLVHGQASASNH